MWVTSTGPSLSSGAPSPRELGPQTTTYKVGPLVSPPPAQLPERDGVFEYSITSPTEPYERVAIESELIATDEAPVTR